MNKRCRLTPGLNIDRTAYPEKIKQLQITGQQKHPDGIIGYKIKIRANLRRLKGKAYPAESRDRERCQLLLLSNRISAGR